MARYAPELAQLIAQLGRLPSIGHKTAQRLAFHLMSIPESDALALAEAIQQARQNIHLCSNCCNLTDVDPCPICSDESRDPRIICVVEQPSDVTTIEKAGGYQGLYHVLHGTLSPLKQVLPDDIHIRELLQRLRDHLEIEEVFLANSSTAEGEATALYLARLLRDTDIRVTRLAQGLPAGTSLEFTDQVTLSRAIEGRQVLSPGQPPEPAE